MVKSLFKMFSKPKNGKELLTELDISRVVGSRPQSEDVDVEPSEEDPQSNIDTWKKNDLDILQMTWDACRETPEDEEAVAAFRSALHNLHGASGAYGGGALTRLSGSLHELVSGVEDLTTDAALINLHVQACRATLMTDGDAAEDVADAVCDALEYQVSMRLVEFE